MDGGQDSVVAACFVLRRLNTGSSQSARRGAVCQGPRHPSLSRLLTLPMESRRHETCEESRERVRLMPRGSCPVEASRSRSPREQESRRPVRPLRPLSHLQPELKL